MIENDPDLHKPNATDNVLDLLNVLYTPVNGFFSNEAALWESSLTGQHGQSCPIGHKTRNHADTGQRVNDIGIFTRPGVNHIGATYM